MTWRLFVCAAVFHLSRVHVGVLGAYYMYVKVLMGLREIPFFSAAVETHSYRRTIQRSAFVVTQLIVPGGVLLCACWCECVCVLHVYLCMCICVCLLPGINSVGCVPAGDSVEDDGCAWTSSVPPSVSAAAAAVEQGISACSCIHTHPRATATAQAPPPG